MGRAATLPCHFFICPKFHSANPDTEHRPKAFTFPLATRTGFFSRSTEKRARWLAQSPVQRALHDLWQGTATAWLVSDYLLMPDHVHLFCAPNNLKFTIERWIGFWKDQFAKNAKNWGGAAAPPCRKIIAPPGHEQINGRQFQAGGFHHRLRDGENYAQKWQYVRENPVRAGLVARPEDSPYQGRVHEINW